MKEERFLEIARAVSDPTRFAILSKIAQTKGDLACANLTGAMEITPATISHHIKELSAAGLIEARREGKFNFYRVNQSAWSEYLKELTRRVPTS